MKRVIKNRKDLKTTYVNFYITRELPTEYVGICKTVHHKVIICGDPENLKSITK